MSMVHTPREKRKWGARPRSRGQGFRELAAKRNGLVAVRVMPGGFYVTTEPDRMLMTLLGSCVAACIRDPLTGFSGMNHFMLPANPFDKSGPNNDAMRFGNFAMEVLINELLASGCPRERLEAKVFGGAVLGTSGGSAVGPDNAAFVLQYLEREGMKVIGSDLGGEYPRKVHFYPVTGKVRLLHIEKPEMGTLVKEEMNFRRKITSADKAPPPKDDGVELF
jgi:chemotaxis protein CheD